MLSITLFVDGDAAAGGNGLGWGTAYDDLQAALSQATVLNGDATPTNDVDSIWIAEGTYKPSDEIVPGEVRSASFSLVDGVTLYGGFAGTETMLAERILGGNSTKLSGNIGTSGVSDNACTVVFCGKNITAGADNLTITDGNADETGNPDALMLICGGGIYNFGNLTLSNVKLTNNSAAMDGGGIYDDCYQNSAALTIIDSVLSDNSAGANGGGIYRNGSSTNTVTIMNSTLWNNSADGDGGGIYHYDSGGNTAMTIANSTLTGNSAGDRGGGIFSEDLYYDTSVTITNSTLRDNLASSGGGFYNKGAATLYNTIIAGNSSDIFQSTSSQSGSHNLIGDGTGQSALVDGIDGNQVGTSAAPIDPMLSGLTQFDNGMWGYDLQDGSPAIDAGDNEKAVDTEGEPLATDIAGNDRIFLNGTVDIGAVEFTPEIVIYTVTSLDDTIANDGILTFIEAFQAANTNLAVGDAEAGSDEEVDVIQFADGLSGTVLVDDGELEIEDDLVIEGPGSGLLTFDADGQNRIFSIESDVSATLNGMTLTGGSATEGGAIYNDSGILLVRDTIFTGNSTSGDGGAIYNYYYAEATIEKSVIENNSSSDDGGAVFNYNSELTIIDSTFRNNSTVDDGGAIYNHNKSTLTITNSAFLENSADDKGGVFYTYLSDLTITNSTITNNSAKDGGAMHCNGSAYTTTLNNTIVAGNTATSGDADISFVSGTLVGAYNLIGDGSDQSDLVNGVDGNQIGTETTPIDPMLDNEGKPLESSPVIDAGDNALVPVEVTEDLAGNNRIENVTVDIGAYEFVSSPGVPGDANGDGKVDGSDVTILANNWQAGVSGGSSSVTWSMGDFNGDGKVDGSDVTILANNWQTGVTLAETAVSSSETTTSPSTDKTVMTPPATFSRVATVPRADEVAQRVPVRANLTKPAAKTALVLHEAAWNRAAHDMAMAELATHHKTQKGSLFIDPVR